MLLVLFLLFTVIPVVEIALLIKLGGLLGPWLTIALVLGTGMAGAALARWQGVRAATRVQSELSKGVLPAAAMVDGLLILVAGVLLITPGALTDVLGLALLIPPTRAGIRRGLTHWLSKHVQIEGSAFTNGNGVGATPGQAHDEIIEAHVVETRVVDE